MPPIVTTPVPVQTIFIEPAKKTEDPSSILYGEMPVFHLLLEAEGQPVEMIGENKVWAERLAAKGYAARIMRDWFFVTPAGVRRIQYEAAEVARLLGTKF